jgi:hypothetical protein
MMNRKGLINDSIRRSNLVRAPLRELDRASLYLVESLNENGYEFCVGILGILKVAQLRSRTTTTINRE